MQTEGRNDKGRKTEYHLQNKVFQMRKTQHSTKLTPIHHRLHEHQLEVKRHEISFLISMNVDNCRPTFDWRIVEILDRGNTKSTRNFLAAWHSGHLTINKHVEIDPVYQLTRKMVNKYRTKNHINGRYSRNGKVGDDRLKVNNNQSRSRSTGQFVSHMW